MGADDPSGQLQQITGPYDRLQMSFRLVRFDMFDQRLDHVLNPSMHPRLTILLATTGFAFHRRATDLTKHSGMSLANATTAHWMSANRSWKAWQQVYIYVYCIYIYIISTCVMYPNVPPAANLFNCRCSHPHMLSHPLGEGTN